MRRIPLVAFPCAVKELEAALHRVCDHHGLWDATLYVVLDKNRNCYMLEVEDGNP